MFKLFILAAVLGLAAAKPNQVLATYSYSAPGYPVYSAPGVSYAAPAVSYAAPAVSYAAPAVSYRAPAVSYSHPGYSAPAVYTHKPVVSYAPPALSYSPVVGPVYSAPYSYPGYAGVPVSYDYGFGYNGYPAFYWKKK